MTIIYSFNGVVTKVEEIKDKEFKGGFGEKAAFEEKIIGWKVIIADKINRIGYVFPFNENDENNGKPNLNVDDSVKISIQQVRNK